MVEFDFDSLLSSSLEDFAEFKKSFLRVERRRKIRETEAQLEKAGVVPDRLVAGAIIQITFDMLGESHKEYYILTKVAWLKRLAYCIDSHGFPQRVQLRFISEVLPDVVPLLASSHMPTESGLTVLKNINKTKKVAPPQEIRIVRS